MRASLGPKIIKRLSEVKTMNLTQIMRFFEIENGNAWKMMDRLVEKGLVEVWQEAGANGRNENFYRIAKAKG